MTPYPQGSMGQIARRTTLLRRLEFGIVAAALAVAIVAGALWMRGGPALRRAGEGETPLVTMFSILAMSGDVTFLQGGKVLISDLDLRANFRVRLGENARLVLQLARNLVIGLSRQADVEFRPRAGDRRVTFYLASGTSRVAIDAGQPGDPTGVRVQTAFADLEASYASFEATVVPDGLYVVVDKGVVRATIARTGRQILVVAGGRLFVSPTGDTYRFGEGAGPGRRGGQAGLQAYAAGAGGPLVGTEAEARARAAAEAASAKSINPLLVVRRMIFQSREDLENLDVEPCVRRSKWPFLLKDEKLVQETVMKAYVILTARYKKVEIELPGERHWPIEKLEIAQLSVSRILARYPCRVALTGRVGSEEDKVKWKDIEVTLVFEKIGERWLAVSMDFPDKVPVWVTKPEEYKKLEDATEK